MKTRIIKEKLEGLLAGSVKKKTAKKNLKAITTLLKQLNQKELRLRQAMLTIENTDDKKKLKRKLKLIKLQIDKAETYKQKLKSIL